MTSGPTATPLARSTSIRAAYERASQRVVELSDVLAAVIDASSAANLDDEHDPEGATVGFERAQLTALLERARAQLGELDAALERLELGTYGSCERCGTLIPQVRLEAQPATRVCVACASL